MNPALRTFWETCGDWHYVYPPGSEPFNRNGQFTFTNAAPAATNQAYKVIEVECTKTQCAVVQQIVIEGFNLEDITVPYIGQKWVKLDAPNFNSKMFVRLRNVVCHDTKAVPWSVGTAGQSVEGIYDHGVIFLPHGPVIGHLGKNVVVEVVVNDVTNAPLLSPNGAMLRVTVRGFITNIDN